MSAKPKDREPGFYEVTIQGKPRKTVASWGPFTDGDKENHWRVHGIDRPLNDSDLLEIGRKMEVKP